MTAAWALRKSCRGLIPLGKCRARPGSRAAAADPGDVACSGVCGTRSRRRSFVARALPGKRMLNGRASSPSCHTTTE